MHLKTTRARDTSAQNCIHQWKIIPVMETFCSTWTMAVVWARGCGECRLAFETLEAGTVADVSPPLIEMAEPHQHCGAADKQQPLHFSTKKFWLHLHRGSVFRLLWVLRTTSRRRGGSSSCPQHQSLKSQWPNSNPTPTPPHPTPTYSH